jgi:hypothetical protein
LGIKKKEKRSQGDSEGVWLLAKQFGIRQGRKERGMWREVGISDYVSALTVTLFGESEVDMCRFVTQVSRTSTVQPVIKPMLRDSKQYVDSGL